MGSRGKKYRLWKERLLSALLVRDNETTNVIYFLAFFLLIGAGMALGRGSADALFFKRYGIEHLPTMYVVMGLLLAMTGVLYAAFADRLPAERFFTIIFMILAGILGVEWLVMLRSGSEHIYPAYYLTYEIVSEILLVHGALYLSQNFNTLQAKRLIPLVLAGAQIGSIFGGVALAILAKPLGVHNVLLVWCGLLACAVLLLSHWHNKRGPSAYFRAQARTRNRATQSLQQIMQTIRLAGDSKLLRAVSFAQFLMVITFYIMCYSVNRVYTQLFQSEETLAAFFGMLAAVTGTLGLLLQVFVTNRFIERFGVRRTNLMFPAFSVIAVSALLVHFGFLAALITSFNKETIMPAFRKPVRAIIYNALPHAIQGRARAMSVVLVMPAALLCCGGLLWALQLLENPIYFLVPGLGFALLYLHFSRRMNQAYTEALVDHLEDRLFLPDDTPAGALKGSGEAGLNTLINGVEHKDEQIALTFARTMVASFPDRASTIVTTRLASASPILADQLLKLLAELEKSEFDNQLRNWLDKGDNHLKSTILWFLFRSQQDEACELVQASLTDANARIRAAAIFGALHYPIPELRENALAAWKGLCKDPAPACINAMQLLELLPALPADDMEHLGADCRGVLLDLRNQADINIIERTLRAIDVWPLDPLPELIPVISMLATESKPSRRKTAIKSLWLLPATARRDLIMEALDDPHKGVRCTAIKAMEFHESDFEMEANGLLQSESRLSPRGQSTLLDTLVERGLPINTLFTIAQAKTLQAQMMDSAIATVQSHPAHVNNELVLLTILLKERCMQYLDIALSALQHAGEARQVGVIRAAIRSGDHRYMANAGEALRNLNHPELSRSLCRILETVMENRKKPSTMNHFTGLIDVINWCQECGDNWLQTCASEIPTDLSMKAIT